MEYAVSDEVRSQDSWTLLALLLNQRETQDQAWEFVQTHWEEIERKSTAGSGARIVEATGAFCSVEKREQVVDLLRSWTDTAARLAAGQSAGPIDPDQYTPGSDSGEASGLPAARLTLTFGFGAGLFVKDGHDRYGLAASRLVSGKDVVERAVFADDHDDVLDRRARCVEAGVLW